jgi:7-cyano-7-deazaguanine synthase
MKTLVVASGGADSISTLSLAKGEVEIISFNYGQKATRELQSVINIAKKLNMKYNIIDISFLKEMFGTSNQLTGDSDIKPAYQQNVVVPLRNSMFLQIAYIYALTHDFDIVMLGSHMGDCAEIDGERLYPDCSPEFFKAFQHAMDLGTFRKEKKVQVVTPSILGLSKFQLLQKGYEYMNTLLFESWSCYKSEELHCGNCESCNNRKSAFALAGIEDKTIYAQ